MTAQAADPWVGDLMRRKGVAKFLTNYVDEAGDIKVLSVNAPWGSGKTFFIERWHQELCQTRACVYFNAWQHDYIGDAFVSLSAVLHEQLEKQTALPDKVIAAGKKFSEVASRAIIAATPLLAKGLLKKAIGVEVAEFQEAYDADDTADAAAAVVRMLIENNTEALKAVAEFKTSLEEMALSASTHASTTYGCSSAPVYIFIDELDRCRPTFAIELLERIKHFFDVEHCRFVIAVDKQQLACSIKAVYGESFDSAKYLRRFFDAEYALDSTRPAEWIKANVDFGQLQFVNNVIGVPSNLGTYHHDPVPPIAEAVLDGGEGLTGQQLIVLGVVQSFNLSLRDLQKAVKQLRAIRNNFAGEFNLLWACYLVCLRIESEDLYIGLIKRRPDVDVFKALRVRHRNVALYTGFGNFEIHELMWELINFYHQPPQQARAAIRSILQSDAVDEFKADLYMNVSNHQKEFRLYPALVELAHSLD